LFHEFDSIRQLEKVVVGPDVKSFHVIDKSNHIFLDHFNVCL